MASNIGLSLVALFFLVGGGCLTGVVLIYCPFLRWVFILLLGLYAMGLGIYGLCDIWGK